MPTVGVGRDELFARLGQTSYTPEDLVEEGKAQHEFDELCFEFGIELDDVTSDRMMAANEIKNADAEAQAKLDELDDTVIYKIDIPANRYDLLCIEGIARSLRIFKGLESAPTYQIIEPAQRQIMRVKPSVKDVPRPFVVCAVLRGMNFEENNYKSFIDLQDKLHQNICRMRKLVAIGTHDLDVVEGPFQYDAQPRDEVSFVPLTEEDKEWTGKALLDHYNTDPGCKHLKPYTKLIYDCPNYPVISDAKGRVMSMPPIINGAHSRIQKGKTTNVFIECTATDLTKAHIVLDTMVTMFSEYCSEKFSVEPVDVIYETADGGVESTETTPRLSSRMAEAQLTDICSVIGVELDAPTVCELCTKMQLGPASYDEATGTISVTVPPTRSDILHAVDIIEDVAIAYGFNKLIPGEVPPTQTVGGPLPLNHFSDQLRDEVARAGFTEVLTHGLCMTRENFDNLRRVNDGSAVQLSNPANEEYEVVRTTLLPGLLKTLKHNKSMPVKDGIKFYEISDVVLQDTNADVGARNERHLAATYAGLTDGFEVIHGLVDRVMQLNLVKPESQKGDSATYYKIQPTDDQAYYEGRRAEVVLVRPVAAAAGAAAEEAKGDEVEEIVLGTFGAVHPLVLAKDKYDLQNPCSAVELNLEPLGGFC